MTLQTRTSIWQKTALVFLGLFLSLVFLEGGMRLGGFVLLSMQEYGNLQSIKQRGAYRILCLGESTTQRQYPKPLEQVLNQRNTGVSFSVIDKGISGTNTNAILGQVESYLAEYRPDMVVAMMGANDRGHHIPFEKTTVSKWALFIRSLRIYKLTRLLELHLLTKARKMGFLKPAGERLGSVKAQTPLSRTALRGTSVKAIFTEENPRGDDDQVELGRLYYNQGKFSQAEDSFEKALELDPKNDTAYVELGRLRMAQYKDREAADMVRKACEINPKNGQACVQAGYFCQRQGQYSEAEAILKKTIEINPRNTSAFFGLGGLYREQGKLSQAEDVLKKAIEIKTDRIAREKLLRAMASLYEEMGKPVLAKVYAEKADRLTAKYYISGTVNNYRKLKEILDKKGIKLVCVQYPMRNVEPLKRIFENDKSVIFVDNESVFKKAVKKGSHKEYFVDMFGGDFGHCTQKGNELLAQNIADVILREVFNKR